MTGTVCTAGVRGALALAVVLAVSTAGCERTLPAQSEQCWAIARNLVRSPSTAKLIDHTEGIDKAYITMDAANAYGTPIRMHLACSFDDKDLPAVVTSAVMDGSAVDPAALIEARALALAEEIRKR